MASKVIGFRIPVDVAEELEKVSEEHGMTIAEFLRSLVDETLYPGGELNDEESDDVTRGQVESLSKAHRKIADDVQELTAMVDRIGVKIAGYEVDGILSPKIVEIIQEIETTKGNTKNLEDKVDTLSVKLKSVQDTVKLANEYKAPSDLSYSELQKEVSLIRLQLADMNSLSTRVKQLESEVTQQTKDTALMKIEVKRQPTDETRTLAYADGSEHKFRVYKSPAGLMKPYVAYTTLSGKRYVDLKEPIN